MKKIGKVLALSIIVILSLICFVACGKDSEGDTTKKNDVEEKIENNEKVEEKSNGSVEIKKDFDEKVTGIIEQNDDEIGKYTEVTEGYFKNGKIVSVSVSMNFEDKEKAEAIYNMYKLLLNSSEDEEDQKEDIDISMNGNNVTIMMEAESFLAEENANTEDFTKESFIKSLEEEGYTIK